MSQKFYLVSPGADKHKKPRPHYWSKDIGEKWVGIARGIYREKHNDDLITEIVEVPDLTRLDWSKTPFRNDNLMSGWLSRDGAFFGCPERYHDIIAYCVLGMKVSELEERGWTRVLDSSRFTCEHRLSPEQRNWLSMNGFRVPDYY